MKCVICNSAFYQQTRMEPFEPCDCGECVSPLADREATGDEHKEIAAMRENWKNYQRTKCERCNEPVRLVGDGTLCAPCIDAVEELERR